MKILRTVVLVTALLAAASAGRAEENRYDLLGEMLMPFVNVFAKDSPSPNRAFTFTVKLEQMTDLPADLAGSHAEVAVEYPDKFRLHGPVMGEDIVICRHGQDLWAWPGSKVEALLKTATEQRKLPKLDPKYRLAPFSLPVPEKELVFLPALFQLKDVGSEPLDGENCRVLDVYLMPELAKALKGQGWAARTWIRGDAKPARISVAKPGWMLVVRFDQVEFAPSLPEATWQPTSEQSSDILKLDPPHFQQLLGAIVK